MASERGAPLVALCLLALGCTTPPPAPKAVAPIDSALASEVRRLGRSLHGTVIVRSNVAGAKVEIDGKPIRLDAAELIDVLGPHEVVLTAPGYEEKRSAVSVTSQQHSELYVALEPPPRRPASEGRPRPPATAPVATPAVPQTSTPARVGRDDAVDPFASP